MGQMARSFKRKTISFKRHWDIDCILSFINSVHLSFSNWRNYCKLLLNQLPRICGCAIKEVEKPSLLIFFNFLLHHTHLDPSPAPSPLFDWKENAAIKINCVIHFIIADIGVIAHLINLISFCVLHSWKNKPNFRMHWLIFSWPIFLIIFSISITSNYWIKFLLLCFRANCQNKNVLVIVFECWYSQYSSRK